MSPPLAFPCERLDLLRASWTPTLGAGRAAVKYVGTPRPPAVVHLLWISVWMIGHRLWSPLVGLLSH